MTWKVPVISQRTTSLCWEACGRMLWAWRKKSTPQSRKMYSLKAGTYGRMKQGLFEQQMDVFYRQLGIRSLKNPSGENIRHALKWTPVIVTSVDKGKGHAMVVTGHNKGKYSIINPCAVQVVNFATPSGDSCSAASILIPEQGIDKSLGQYIWYW